MHNTYVLVKRIPPKSESVSYYSAELGKWMPHPMMASEYNSLFVAKCVLNSLRGDYIITVQHAEIDDD